VVVPLGLLLAVALAATLGGGGLGGLEQLVHGPSLPGAGPVAGALQTGGRGATGGVPAVPAGAAGAARSPAGLGSGAGNGGSDGSSGSRDPGGSSAPAGSGQGTTRTDDGPEPPTQTTPAVATPGPTPDATVTPTPPEPPQDPGTEIVRGVGTVADQAVRPLPIVGGPAADAVATVIDLVAPPRSAAPAPGVVTDSAVPAP